MAGTFLRSKYQSAPKRRYRDMRLPLSAGIAILVAGLALSACAGGAASVPSPKANQSPSSPVQASFRHLKMISETSGWALADTAGGTSVVRTDDGALDWSANLRARFVEAPRCAAGCRKLARPVFSTLHRSSMRRTAGSPDHATHGFFSMHHTTVG